MGFCTYRNRSDDGRFAFNINKISDKAIVSKFYPVFRFVNANSTFMTEYLNSSARARKKLSVLAVGTSQVVLSFEALKSAKFDLPCKEEQDKIAALLECINTRIAQQHAYVNALKKYKRGAIKNFFTQELTFAENKPKWERHKLGELIFLQSGQDFAPSDYNDHGEGIPYMTGASCIVEGKTVVSRWTSTPRCLAYCGDTLLVCKGSGSGAVVMLSQEKVHIARQFMALRPREVMTKGFCFFLTLYLSEKMKQSATGLIEGIDRKTVLNQDVLLPSILEQEKIVSFLSAIEKTLLAQERTLKNLVSTKKGLMQQLFI